jgi:hypothetical protein
MAFTLAVFLLCLGLFAGMIALLHLGRRLAARGSAETGSGTIDGAVLGLLGLLLAFTVSGAAERFDVRRRLVVDESNAIGTAYLRLQVLPEAARRVLEDRFRRYVDLRLETYRSLPDLDAVNAALERTKDVQRELWEHAVAASATIASAPLLVLPALNEMFDIAATRTMAARMHPPRVIFVMLFAFALFAAFLAGYGTSRRTLLSRAHGIGFALVIASAVYVIIDLEYPRLGLFRVEDFDSALADVRAGMR